MFKRNRDAPLDRLRIVYQQYVNANLANLTLAQQARLTEAVQGFRALNRQADQQLEEWNACAKGKWTAEEMLLLEELNKLRAEIEDNCALVEGEWTHQQAQQAKAEQMLPPTKAAPVAQQPQSQPQTPRRAMAQYTNRLMKRSLRPNGGMTSSTSVGKKSTSSSATSQSAKQAANVIWAPSASIQTHQSNSLTSTSSNELFAGFESTDNLVDPMGVDGGTGLARKVSPANETLRPSIPRTLSHSPSSPYDSPDEDLVDHMTHLKLKQTSKDRSRAALQASAQVRRPQRPGNVRGRQERHTRQLSSQSVQSQQGLQKPYRANGSSSSMGRSHGSSPVRVPVTTRGIVDTSDDDDAGDSDEALFKELKIDAAMGRQIVQDMNSNDDEVRWTDVAGLDGAKQALMEAVVWPLLRPDLFTGLRQPPNGMLLFGPPGTGKTMLARAAATESESNFFSIQASSITSKFLGESEKLVRALFQIAKAKAPSIIFVDEIDSIMGQRSESGENDSMRRVKNEFLVQWSSLTKSAGRGESSRVLVLAATNLPWAIDDAARRRFVKRQYIPLPEPETRRAQFTRLLANAENNLSEQDLEKLVDITEGYSGSDIDSLTKDAAMSTTRGLTWEQMMDKNLTVRPISLEDFKVSMQLIKPSVGQEGLAKFEKWVKEFGSSGA